jgi:perosamine synthetase
VGIPVNIPLFAGNEKKYLNECIDTGWISSEGPFVKRFEEEFAHFVGQKYAVAVTNGTVALDIAIQAAGIGKGDEVIIPSFTIISCASSVVLAGAKPIVVDVNPDDWNINVELIEEAITPQTKAIMPVHIYGLPSDMDPIRAIAKKHNLLIIEDAAQAHGLTYNQEQCGSMGDLSCFSFYPNKHITTGEGGMVLTSDEKLYRKVHSLRNLCFRAEERFVHHDLGTNARMTNLQAALGVAQLERIPQIVARKREIGRIYLELLAGIKQITLPLSKKCYAENIFWVFGIILKDSYSGDAKSVMKKLGERGVGTRPFFYPINQQPALKKLGWYQDQSCPVAEKLYKRGFYIPSGLGISNEQISIVANTLKEILI